MSDIFSDANKRKLLTSYDIPKVKHMCIMLYGFDWWRSVGLDEVFEQLPLIQKELGKQAYRDEVQKLIARCLGAKLK